MRPNASRPLEADALLADWRRLAAQGANNRAIAARLGVSEARLLDAGRGSLTSRLRCDAGALLAGAARLGTIKMVLRNDCAVLERPGAVRSVFCGGPAILVEGSSFHLLLNATALHSAFAVREGGKLSLQLFDTAGVSIAKLILRPESDAAAFDSLESELALDRPGPLSGASPPAPRHAAGDVVAPDALADFLHGASARGDPIRLAVSNDSATMQVEDSIRRVKRSDSAPWINVLDPQLDLHLFEARIRRLSRDGARLHWLADDGAPAFSAG